MLEVEPSNSAGVRSDGARTTSPRAQSRCSSRGNVSPNNYARSQQRLDFEKELTFSPKLNESSLKLVQDRRDQGFLQRSKSPRETCHHSEFTFRPRMSNASLKIAEGLGTTFMARQEMHLEKQKKLLDQNKQLGFPLKGRLSPVIKNKKKENSDNLAWGTPVSTPNLNAKTSSLSLGDDDTSSLHPGGVFSGSSPSLSSTSQLLNPVRGGGTRGGGGVSHIQSSINLQPISDTSSPYAPGNSSLLLVKRQKSIIKDKSPRLHKRGSTYPTEAGCISDSGNDSDTQVQSSHRRTALSPEPPSPRTRARIMGGHGPAPSGERLRLAKLIAEKAIKKNKVFMIQGPYPVVRECLRRRDWVEKQYRAMAPHKVKKTKNVDSDDESDDDNNPDQDDDNCCHSDGDDDNGLGDSSSVYGIMSRIVRNSSPNFIWTVKAAGIDYKFLRPNTYVNHFAKNSAFTTKVGLCNNLNTSSLGTVDPDSFFPRCYKICSEEDKNAFVADYRLSAACSIVQWVVCRHNGELDIPMDDNEEGEDPPPDAETSTTTPRPTSTTTPRPASTTSPRPASTTATATVDTIPKNTSKAKKNKTVLTTALIDKAIDIINNYISELEHEDIDWPLDKPPLMSDEEWDRFIKNYYQLIHDGDIITGSAKYADQCKCLVNRLRAAKLQLDMEGLRNVWIVKPGAKSRGRGITCMNKLEEILKLVGSAIVQKEGKWVVQKYIERPLLIYETKFDIRQWFLVTDWNPLTVWFYKSCYLRFCGQTFSLEKLDSAIHLSNQSVQKNFDISRTRSRMLPDNNMWTSDEFQTYLKKRGCGNVWEDVVYPGMKKAVIATMESCQEVLEPRKGCFELYGADFMLTEDFHPWLIEINSSPAMGATTEITEKMCYDVIEDTMKVVLDRKHDKNCDTGNFELAFKQTSVSAPQYVGQALAVGGTTIRKPTSMNRQKSSPNLVGSMPRLSMTTAPPRKQCGEPQRSKTLTNKTERTMMSASEDPTTARATNLEDMKKKLAESSPQPPNSGTITAHSQGDSQPHQSSSSSTLVDVAWGRTCAKCGNGAGVRLDPDQTDAKCPCRRDNLKSPTQFIQPPGEPLIQPTIRSQETIMIPRSGTFISNRRGELVTLMGPDPIPGMHKTGRAGFMQGKTRPNNTRQRSSMQTVDMRPILPVPFKHAVSNSLPRT